MTRPTEIVSTIGGGQRYEMALIVQIDGNLQLLLHCDSLAAKSRLAIDKHPHVTPLAGSSRSGCGGLPAAAKNRNILYSGFAWRMASRSKVIPLLACMPSTECQDAE